MAPVREEFAPEKYRRLNALVTVARQRLQELLQEEANVNASPSASRSRSPRNKRPRKNSIISADHKEEEYSGDRDQEALLKRRKCNINIPKNNKKKAPVDDGPEPPPPLPESFKKVMQEIARGGQTSDVKLVIQKGLELTDLATTQNRLSIPFTKIRDHGFLTDEEAQFLTTRDAKNKMKYKEVTIIEPSLRLEQVKLRRWDMRKGDGGKTSSHYVISCTWRYIVDRNKLTANMVVQLWSFRIDQVLHLALVKLPPPSPSHRSTPNSQ